MDMPLATLTGQKHVDTHGTHDGRRTASTMKWSDQEASMLDRCAHLSKRVNIDMAIGERSSHAPA
jgi:hypothetical protein